MLCTTRNTHLSPSSAFSRCSASQRFRSTEASPETLEYSSRRAQSSARRDISLAVVSAQDISCSRSFITWGDDEDERRHYRIMEEDHGWTDHGANLINNGKYFFENRYQSVLSRFDYLPRTWGYSFLNRAFCRRPRPPSVSAPNVQDQTHTRTTTHQRFIHSRQDISVDTHDFRTESQTFSDDICRVSIPQARQCRWSGGNKAEHPDVLRLVSKQAAANDVANILRRQT